MDPDPCPLARRILGGMAEVEDSSACNTEARDDWKEPAVSVVEVLDEASNSPLCPPALRKECLVALPTLCITYGMLPSRYFPAGPLVVDHQSTICVGGADVRYGTLDGLAVTVRSIPYNLKEPPYRSQEEAYREVITWKNLDHPNVLPLLGINTSISPPLSAISACMEYGSLGEYLASFPKAPRAKLLFDVSRGLEYMHGLDCIHGDLKGSNILVNGGHSAVLTNFRLASFLRDSEVDIGASISECDLRSVRWLAPELLFPEKFGLKTKRRTKQTDIYAFAMMMYEVFSASFPFQGFPDEALILRIRSGDRPHRPKNGSDLGLTDELWRMTKACWERRDRRWKISRIVSTLEIHSLAVTSSNPPPKNDILRLFCK